MKKSSLIVISCAALTLAGCKNQGGSSDQYNTDSGAVSNTNYYPNSSTNNYQGGALSPGRINTGADYSTNHSGFDTNDQDGANSPQTFDTEGKRIGPTNTNNVPEN